MATKKTSDQTPDDYPDLSAGAAPVAEAEAEEAPQAEAQPSGPRFNPKRPFSMVWHAGLKAYLQDGVIFDRGSKEPVGKA